MLGYEKMLDEHGREMHGSWGNVISADEAFARMGADVMRWQYCQQPPNQNLLFGFGPGKEIQRKLLTLWNSVSFLRRLRGHGWLHARAWPTWTRRPGRDGLTRGLGCSRSTAGCWPGPRGSSRTSPAATSST